MICKSLFVLVSMGVFLAIAIPNKPVSDQHRTGNTDHAPPTQAKPQAPISVGQPMAMAPEWPSQKPGLGQPPALTSGALMFRAHALDNPASQETEQDRQRRDYMRAKLNFTQSIIEGLSTQNFEMIASGASEIKLITEGALWAAEHSNEYIRMSDEIRLAADRLQRAAQDENLDGAALRFLDLMLNCVDCHQQIAGKSF